MPALAPQGQEQEPGAKRSGSGGEAVGRQAVVPAEGRTPPPGRRPVLAWRPTSRIGRADPPLGGSVELIRPREGHTAASTLANEQ